MRCSSADEVVGKGPVALYVSCANALSRLDFPALICPARMSRIGVADKLIELYPGLSLALLRRKNRLIANPQFDAQRDEIGSSRFISQHVAPSVAELVDQFA